MWLFSRVVPIVVILEGTSICVDCKAEPGQSNTELELLIFVDNDRCNEQLFCGCHLERMFIASPGNSTSTWLCVLCACIFRFSNRIKVTLSELISGYFPCHWHVSDVCIGYVHVRVHSF